METGQEQEQTIGQAQEGTQEPLVAEGIPPQDVPDKVEPDGQALTQAPPQSVSGQLPARKLNNEIIPALTLKLNEFLLLTSQLSTMPKGQARDQAQTKQDVIKAEIDAVLSQLGQSEIA